MNLIERVFKTRENPGKFINENYNRLTFDITKDNIDDVISLMSATAIVDAYSKFAKLSRYIQKYSQIKEVLIYKYFYNEILGFYSKNTSDFQAAISYFAIATKVANEMNNPILIINSQRLICSVYFLLRDYEMASYFSIKCIEALKNIKDDSLYANVYNTYGVILVEKKEYKEAVSVYNLAISYYERVEGYENHFNYALAHLNIFEALVCLDQDEEAEKHLNIGTDIVYRNNFFYFINDLLLAIANFYAKHDEYKKALLYTNKYIEKRRNLLSPKFSLGRERDNEEIRKELYEISSLKEKNEALLNRLKSLHQMINIEADKMLDQQLIEQLNDAINNDEITAFYQPKWSVEKQRFFGAEALIRWVKDGEIIPPGVFIEKIETNEIICKLSEIVIKNAVAITKKVVDMGHSDFIMSVNITPYQLINQELASLLARELAFNGLDGKNLEIEVTERSFIEQNPRILEELFRIKEMGITIALDDFGTGYSSLACVNTLPFSVIKIDRALVSDVGNEKSAKLLDGLFRMIHSLDLHAIAEGVETQNQLEWLIDMGCKQMQGYYFSKPLIEVDFIEIMK